MKTKRPKIKEYVRPDGRPEAYDVPKGVQLRCFFCELDGHLTPLESGKIVLMAAQYWTDREPKMVCVETHAPDDVVIFNPDTGLCRDKTGQNVWKEGQ